MHSTSLLLATTTLAIGASALSFQHNGDAHLAARHAHAHAAAHHRRAPAAVAAGSSSSAKRMIRKAKRASRVTYSSTANFFAKTGGYSACHTYFGDDDMVIAIPTGLWQDVSKPSPLCGQQVIATNPVDGTSVALTVQDASWSSTYATMPRGAFLALGGSEVDGVLPIEFYFKDAKSIDSSLLPTETAGATDVSWAPTTPKANHAEESETVSGKVASATSVKVEVEAEPATAAAPVVPASSATTEAPVATTTSVQAASVDSKVAAVRITTTTTTTEAPRPTTTAFDSASAASASKASADAAYASSSSASAAAAAASQAAAAEAEKQAAADAAAAASKSSADAAWASSSSAAAAAAKPTTTTEAPAPEPTQDEPSNGGGGQVFTGGYATYYLQNGNAGHCGTVASDDSKVIALPSAMYADGAHCGQQIKITRVDNGATVVATVRDSCPTCVNNESLDLSVGAFTAIATESEGMVGIKWSWA